MATNEVMALWQNRWTGRERAGARERVVTVKYRQLKAAWQMGQVAGS